MTPIPSSIYSTLPSSSFNRAAVLLGLLVHGYYYYAIPACEGYEDIPDSILKPWEYVNERLGRKKPTMSYNDLILNNWNFVSGTLPDSVTDESFIPGIPFFGNSTELIFNLTQVSMHYHGRSLNRLFIEIFESTTQTQPSEFKRTLLQIKQVINKITKTFKRISPCPHSPSYCDPTVWAQTVGKIPIPIKFETGTRGASGIEAPVFHLLDAGFGRTKYESGYGRDSLEERLEWLPVEQREFVNLINNQPPLRSYVLKFPELIGLWNSTIEAYIGDSGLLGYHGIKAVGYLENAMKVGRVDMNGTISEERDWRGRMWKGVRKDLEEARKERNTARTGGCVFARGRIGGVERSNGNGSGLMIRVEAAVDYMPGDCVEVVPRNTKVDVEKVRIIFGFLICIAFVNTFSLIHF